MRKTNREKALEADIQVAIALLTAIGRKVIDIQIGARDVYDTDNLRYVLACVDEALASLDYMPCAKSKDYTYQD